METLSIRLNTRLSKEMERCLVDFNYSTKTEFVREAIREKISKADKERALKALTSFRGAFKEKTAGITREDYLRVRKEVADELRSKLSPHA